MKIGLAEWGFREYPLDEHFKLTHDLGVQYLEVGCGNENDIHRLPKNPDNALVAQLNEIIQKYEIDTSFGAIGGGYAIEDESLLEKIINEQKAQLESLQQIGVKIVRIFASWTPINEMNEAKWKNMIDALKELDFFASSKGMKLAIETHGTLKPSGLGSIHLHNATTDWDSLKKLLNALPSHTGILFDPGNMRAVIDRPLDDYVDLLNNHIIALHIKDWRQNPDGSWTTVAVGDTEFNWAPIFKKIKYDGVGLIEYEDVSDVVIGMQKSINYLKSIGFE
ncbi:MAG: sugar phosphate isomerase/epimerase [Oscillospiraceae bacterium]|nr:sugar phosphate isomerase/epimerase [Oscillospiraceae bacterium]